MKQCKRCGKDFIGVCNRQIFCTVTCRQASAASTATMITVYCGCCGSPFQKMSNTNKLFCTIKCYYIKRREREREERELHRLYPELIKQKKAKIIISDEGAKKIANDVKEMLRRLEKYS